MPGLIPRNFRSAKKSRFPPAAALLAAAGAPGAAARTAATGDTTTYTVKSGDTLSRIAKANHTSYKKLMALNDLKTASIKVGQKIKLPAPKEAGS